MALKIEPKKFPNGDTYFRFTIGEEILGSATPKDGGYVIWPHGRTARSGPTTARKMLQAKVEEARKQFRKWRSLLWELEGKE